METFTKVEVYDSEYSGTVLHLIIHRWNYSAWHVRIWTRRVVDFFGVLVGILVGSIFLMPILLVAGSTAVITLPFILLALWGIVAFIWSRSK